MNDAEKLLEKLKGVPKDMPTVDELEAIAQFRKEQESGTLSLRIPKSLHSQLKAEAKAEGISLNQYISFVLASRTR